MSPETVVALCLTVDPALASTANAVNGEGEGNELQIKLMVSVIPIGLLLGADQKPLGFHAKFDFKTHQGNTYGLQLVVHAVI